MSPAGPHAVGVRSLYHPARRGFRDAREFEVRYWTMLARDDLDKIDATQVQAAAKKYFRRDNRTVGFFLPEDNPLRADVPPAPTLADVMKDFKPKEDKSVAEAFDPSQANVDARTKRFEVDGIKVALLSKKNRGEIVNVAIVMRVGNEKALFNQERIKALKAGDVNAAARKYIDPSKLTVVKAGDFK